jgi:hypothetical protein
VAVRRSQRVAEIVFGGAGIARNLFFNEIDNPTASLVRKRATSATKASKGSLKAG